MSSSLQIKSTVTNNILDAIEMLIESETNILTEDARISLLDQAIDLINKDCNISAYLPC